MRGASLARLMDLRPGKGFDLLFLTVSSVGEERRYVDRWGRLRVRLPVEVADPTGEAVLVLYDDQIVALEPGESIQIERGYASKTRPREVYLGRYGRLVRQLGGKEGGPGQVP